MKIIVAGGSGFLGRHVIAELANRGHRVVVLSRGARAPVDTDCDAIESIPCDVAGGQLPLERLKDCNAIVNVIGIKCETASQTFERVHVDATRHLIEAARDLGIRRFVHISVVAARPDRRHAYHDTKWQAEQLLLDSDLDLTILRPGVIYGPGDDMITHLVKMIRFVPLFPVVGSGASILQPVHARDVARCVAETLARPESMGKTYEIVGPDPMMLRDVVRTVADATGLKLWIVPTPMWFQRVSVWMMNIMFANPLSTPAQLQMLVDGLASDPGPIESELGVRPEPFRVETVTELQRTIPPLFGFSLRCIRGCGYPDRTER